MCGRAWRRANWLGCTASATKPSSKCWTPAIKGGQPICQWNSFWPNIHCSRTHKMARQFRPNTAGRCERLCRSSTPGRVPNGFARLSLSAQTAPVIGRRRRPHAWRSVAGAAVSVGLKPIKSSVQEREPRFVSSLFALLSVSLHLPLPVFSPKFNATGKCSQATQNHEGCNGWTTPHAYGR